MEKSKNTFIIKLIIVIIVFIIAFLSTCFLKSTDIKNIERSLRKENIENKSNINEETISKENNENLAKINNKVTNNFINDTFETIMKENTKIDDWRLILVNSENDIPENFTVNLASIDKYRQVDSRIITELMQMIKDMKKARVPNIWIQSAYRSIDEQQKLYYDKVNEYISQGKTKEEAERLTSQAINKPKTSEHNLGLAVDFNYVNYDFEKTKEYAWLLENAKNYGFILRYPKEKEKITQVVFEPWHWRYVGVEHAKKINELGICLEEYIEYLIKEKN